MLVFEKNVDLYESDFHLYLTYALPKKKRKENEVI